MIQVSNSSIYGKEEHYIRINEYKIKYFIFLILIGLTL